MYNNYTYLLIFFISLKFKRTIVELHQKNPRCNLLNLKRKICHRRTISVFFFFWNSRPISIWTYITESLTYNPKTINNNKIKVTSSLKSIKKKKKRTIDLIWKLNHNLGKDKNQASKFNLIIFIPTFNSFDFFFRNALIHSILIHINFQKQFCNYLNFPWVENLRY